MKIQSILACLLGTAIGVRAKVPTVWIAGDSTTAPDGGHNGTEGWDQLDQYDNCSRFLRAGQLSDDRQFTREGRFDRIAQALQPEDWVIIEFGINDVGVPQNGSTSTTGDKGRSDCPGSGNQTCTVLFDNVTEIVQTFPTYVKAAASRFIALGAAGVVIAEQLPTNVWESGNYSYSSPVFAYYSQLATIELGGPASNMFFVQHGAYAAQAQKLLGKAVVDANYPMDHTHTAPFLADVHSQAFVLGLKCGTSPLANSVINATARIEEERGPCIAANATLPI